MLLYSCDICKKNSESTGTYITLNVPRTVEVKNATGEIYKAYIYVRIENGEDSKSLDTFSNLETKSKFESVALEKVKIKNTCPVVCENCKLQILKQSIKDSKIEFKKDNDGDYIAKYVDHITTMSEIKQIQQILSTDLGSESDECEEDEI